MQNTFVLAPSGPLPFGVSGAQSRPSTPRHCANLLGVPVDALDIEDAISLIAERLQSGPKGYVCAIGVHGILEALRDKSVANALANAAIGLPDGAPTVWVGRSQGHRTMNH